MTLAYDDPGPSDGFPLLFLHGTPADRVSARFLRIGDGSGPVRVVAIDRPGIGASSPVRGLTPASWAAAVADLLDHAGLARASILGHSGGGPFALACAAHLSDRIHAVGIVSGSPVRDAGGRAWGGRSGPMVRLCATRPELARGVLWGTGEMVRRWPDLAGTLALALLGRPDRDVLRTPGLRRAFVETVRGAFAQGPEGVRLDAALLHGGWYVPLERIRAPVHLWYGTADRNVSVAVGRALARRLEGSRLTVLQGEGHLSILARHGPEIVRALTPPSGRAGPVA